MGLFSPKQDPYSSSIFTDQDEQPEAIYPFEDVPESVDLSKLCRACSNGVGDGICNYHRSHLHHAFQRSLKIEQARQELEARHHRIWG